MHDWSFERAGADEIAISVQGRWTDYQRQHAPLQPVAIRT